MTNILEYNLTSICPHTNFSCLSVTGEDSTSFLQSQLTNDISILESDLTDHILSGYCNPKGRLIALLRVLKVEKSQYILIMPSDLIETVSSRLKLFILRSKVKIVASNEYSSVIGAWFKNISVEMGKKVQSNNMMFLRDSDCPVFGKRAWVIGDKDITKNLTEKIEDISQIIDFNSFTWKVSELFSGNLWIDKSNTETFIPQSINLDLNHGVSFSKGCYPGQEIVARTHYLGKVKKRLILVEGSEEKIFLNEVKINHPIFQKNTENNSSVEIGFIVDFSYYQSKNSHKKILMLVQCQINELEIESNSHTLNLGTIDGPQLYLRELPYFPKPTDSKFNSNNK
jgi:folate-binding protein YgfZ